MARARTRGSAGATTPAAPARRPPGSKADYVHEVLRHEILNGELPPGAAIGQEEIAARLGVSITPVREALRRLESDGLISYRAHHGATVSELGSGAAEELYLLRAAVEGLTARLAAARITDDGLAQLRRIHERMRGADAHQAAQDSRLFHQTVADIGGPAFLAAHVRSIRQNNPVPPSVSLWNDPDNARLFLDAHERLLEALERRDAEAAERIMAEHIQASAVARTAANSAERAAQAPPDGGDQQ
ncbi:GntR family transcriptional regulator [Streptomonospora sp. S1-112]|uniref:GntR family transcriptional regulator n=1 Tax=Streptomonospora mangrovi TaxID=2883123 RepID=A0A9X3SGG7_9ACTN|nr:GntR family transcriptional regulator [Streptomonospora mangrovi]MDA0564134.1 GntR family transcriptional regulator [Streptomonospora mangrovi]